MRYRAHLASVLLATLLAVFAQTARPPAVGVSFASHVPTPVLVTVRQCLVAINQFIADGDLDELWRNLDRLGHGLDPWPQTDRGQRDIVALAFRSTFPTANLALASIEPSENLYAVRLSARTADSALPVWLDSSAEPDPPDLDLLIDFGRDGRIQRASAVPFTGLIAYTASDPGVPFVLPDRARLVGARITLTPSQRGIRYLTVRAPGMIVPETGSLLLEGEGRLLTLIDGSSRWRQLLPDEITAIAPGDLLYVASGYAILTMTSRDPAKLTYSGVVTPVSHAAHDIEHGRPVRTDLGDMVASASGTPIAAWFGTIESVMSTNTFLPSGMTTLEPTWLLLPAGGTFAVSSNALIVEFGRAGDTEIVKRPSGQSVIANGANHPLLVLVLRAAPK